MSLRSVRKIAIVFVMIVLGAACGDDSPVAPGPGGNDDLAGIWVGAVEESPGGAGQLRLDLQATDVGVSGTFTLQFADEAFSREGTISKARSFPMAQMFSHFTHGCTPEQISAGFLVLSLLNASWTLDGDTLTGRYDGYGCVGTIRGEFQLVRN